MKFVQVTLIFQMPKSMEFWTDASGMCNVLVRQQGKTWQTLEVHDNE
jgi:hypothetical protein